MKKTIDLHVLHIASDFIATKVHISLYKELAKQGVKQTIYCPIRHTALEGSNFFETEGTDIVYDFVISIR